MAWTVVAECLRSAGPNPGSGHTPTPSLACSAARARPENSPTAGGCWLCPAAEAGRWPGRRP
eukprot:8483734-Alexandrium_andersonii.AAC.1